MYFKNFFKTFKNIQNINEVKSFYDSIVSLARNPVLYNKGGVPDTLDGRFELIVLHCHFFIRRLVSVGHTEKEFSQKVINYMFTDFDRSLRELGAGDLSVGKKIKFMVSAYYGRANAYERAIKENCKSLDDVLKKNLYGTNVPKDEEIIFIKKYVKNLLIFINSTDDNKVKDFFKNNIVIEKII